MTVEMFMMYAERLGIPLAILVVFALAVWRVLKWLGEKVVSPITASHIALVNETRECNKVNSETLKQMTSLLQAYTAGISEVVAQGAELAKATTAAAVAALTASTAATEAMNLSTEIHSQGEKILETVLKVDTRLDKLVSQLLQDSVAGH
jgi:hypothetical protein